jgi:hypothetical protein
VLASWVVEILLGLGLIVLWKYRVQMGWLVQVLGESELDKVL